MTKHKFTKTFLAFISFLLLYVASAEGTMAAGVVDVEHSFVKQNHKNSIHPLVNAPLTVPCPIFNNCSGAANRSGFSQRISDHHQYSFHANKCSNIFYLKDAVNRTQYLLPLHLTLCVFRI